METEEKNQVMINEESYTQRRMLFKDIWETAMNIDEKDDIMNKPKVIKTLRLDEVDKCVVGKTKKQRIKNLRHVCNRILDFCDRQDADDVFYEQMGAVGQGPVKAKHKIDVKNPKKKTHRVKKKVKKAKSMLVPQKDGKPMKTTHSERNPAGKIKSLRIHSPVREKKTGAKQNAQAINPKPNPTKEAQEALPSPLEPGSASNESSDSHPSASGRKPVKKKHSKRKKPSDSAVQAIGMMKTKTSPLPRASPKPPNLSKQLPQLTKVMIS